MRRTRKSVNRDKHHLPKIRELLVDRKRWWVLKEIIVYEYPGFETEGNYVTYCKGFEKNDGFGSSQRPNFTYNDCQFRNTGTSRKDRNRQNGNLG